jgi:RNA polymerase sigma factor (sigma-70 family)
MTVADTDSFTRYLNEIRGARPLTRAQEAAYFAAYRERRCPLALKKLVLHNQLFLVSVAKRYYSPEGMVGLSDLIEEGNLGLLQAIERFKPEMGFKFISFAVTWMRKYMLDELARHASVISRPVHHHQRQLRAQRQADASAIRGEVSQAGQEGQEVYVPAVRVVSLDMPLTQFDDLGYHDLVPVHSAHELGELEQQQQLEASVQQAVGCLPETQQQALRMLYGLDGNSPLSAEYVAKELGLSIQALKKIRNQATTNLKTILSNLLDVEETDVLAELLCT